MKPQEVIEKEKQLEIVKSVADHATSKMKQQLCANAVVGYSIVEEGKGLKPVPYNHGCDNDRRNGSKYCQSCSDAHHNEK